MNNYVIEHYVIDIFKKWIWIIQQYHHLDGNMQGTEYYHINRASTINSSIHS